MESIYKMSEVGCQRAVAAPRLGYEPIADESEGNKILLEEATEDETRVRTRLVNAGISVETDGLCQKCLAEFGTERYGIHAELRTELTRVVGHLDGMVWVGHNRGLYPLEIKNLGKFTYEKFRKSQFADFPGYESQIALYLNNGSGVYAVRCRDNGKMLLYALGDLPDALIDKLRQVQASELFFLPAPRLDKTVNKLDFIEMCVQQGELPVQEFEIDSFPCRWCKFRYLCMTEDKAQVKEENLPNLVDAASLWKEGKELQAQAEERMEQAKQSFLTHAKTGVDKFRVGGVSVSYAGLQTKKYLDEKVLRELVSQDILDRAQRESKPWDGITIRVLK